jgi:hypothetical protein
MFNLLCTLFYPDSKNAINTCTHSLSLEFYVLTWQFSNEIHRQSWVEYFKIPDFQQCEQDKIHSLRNLCSVLDLNLIYKSPEVRSTTL